VSWNFSVILICISFMAKEVEHFFMYLLCIWTSSFEDCMHLDFFWGLSVQFICSFIYWIIDCGVRFLSSRYILFITPLSDVQQAIIFSHSIDWLFSLVIIIFTVKKLFKFLQFHLSILSLNW
jgi:hypothetical protein